MIKKLFSCFSPISVGQVLEVQVRYAKVMSMACASRRGSALLITMLMISVISSVSFAVTALALSEFRKAAGIQDSITAYYAAESGIEHGLMEYRLWHDAEISKELYSHVHTAPIGTPLANSQVPTSNQGSPQTFRLDGGAAGAGPGFVAEGGDKGTSWYDLKMSYRSDFVGAVDGSGDPRVDPVLSPRINQSSVAEYDVTGATGIKIAVKFDPAIVNAPPEPFTGLDGLTITSGAAVIVTLTPSSIPSGTCANQQVLNRVYQIEQSQYGTSQAFSRQFGGCGYASARIKPFTSNKNYFMQYSLTAQQGSANMKVDTLKSAIVSTGYAGKSKRTLQINISRTIGTVLESQDFLFLSSGNELSI